jgi:hypothetical protein
MKIISHAIFMIPQLAKMPEQLSKRWNKHLKASAGDIKAALDNIVPDSERYSSRIAEPSHRSYQNYVNKDFKSRAGLSRDEIMARHLDRSKASYQKYKDGIAHIYETVDGEAGKRFKEHVDRAEGHYAESAARIALALSGTKRDGKGPVPKIVAWLAGDMKIVGELVAGDEVKEGGPVLVTTPEKAPGLRSVINQRLNQAGVIIADCAGDKTIMKSQNDLTNDTIQGFVDKKLHLVDFTTGGDSHVDYFVQDGLLCLDVQVSQK